MKKEVQNNVEPQLTPEQIAEREEKIAKQKARKLANDKRLKELHKQEAVDRIEKCKKMLQYFKDSGIYNQLGEEWQKFLVDLATVAAPRTTVSVFSRLFGDNPQVGQTVTLMEAFEKTMKGKAQIDHFIKKKWEPAGIVVSFEQNPDNLLNSVYKLEKLADKPLNEAD